MPKARRQCGPVTAALRQTLPLLLLLCISSAGACYGVAAATGMPQSIATAARHAARPCAEG